MSLYPTYLRRSETVDAYKAEVKAKIKERKENEGKQKREDQSVEQAVANAEMDIPEAMISFQSRQMVDDFARRHYAAGYDDGTVLPVYRSFGRKDDGRV